MSVNLWLRMVGVTCLATAMAAGAQTPAKTPVPNRVQALQALEQPSAEVRLAGVQRLADVGTMADADRLVARLRDDDPRVRMEAAASMWQIWSRSGDKAIDALYQRGMQQMEAARFREAAATFSDIIRKKPAFAEAWNKRATTYYLMGEFDRSLKDCEEVMKRNRNHFGALSGYGQIYLILGDFERSLTYFERALKVNPNMTGAETAMKQIQQHLQEKQRNTI
jgi:tetratricopeptide (TPR) repeat protein